MRIPIVVLGLAAALATAAGCTANEPTADPVETTVPLPVQPVTVPPERQSAFCVAMVDLTDDVRSGDLDDVDAAIVETYRAVEPDVPELIASDFALVLDALERGAPPPTDPPRDTVATTPPVTSATTSADGSTPSAAAEADVGYAPGESPSERVNSYIDFVCRANANNPGPPATPPGEPEG